MTANMKILIKNLTKIVKGLNTKSLYFSLSEPSFNNNDITGSLSRNIGSRNTREIEPFTVTPGEQYAVLVTYLPTTEDTHEGTLTISSNDPSGDTYVSVSGTGLTPPDISVNLDSLSSDL